MLIDPEGRRPQVHPSAYVAPTAVLCGDIRVGPDCRVLFGAVLTDDGGPVELGESSIVMETAVLRGTRRDPTRLGAHVLVGPRAYLVGADVADDCFLATGATVFNGARHGRGCQLRINALVHLRTVSVLPPGTLVPIGWVAVGDPPLIAPPERHEDIWAVQRELDFPGYTCGGCPDPIPAPLACPAASCPRSPAGSAGSWLGMRRTGSSTAPIPPPPPEPGRYQDRRPGLPCFRPRVSQGEEPVGRRTAMPARCRASRICSYGRPVSSSNLPGGEAGLGVQVGEQLLRERHGGGEAGGDAARPGPAEYPVPAQHGGDLGIGIERREELGLLSLNVSPATNTRAAASASSHAIAGQGLPAIEHSSA